MRAISQAIGRLSALPSFFRSEAFWKGSLDPRASLRGTSIQELREFTSSHHWGIYASPQNSSTLSESERTTIEVALALLQRGAWTNCSWRVEQALAEQFETANLGRIRRLDESAGLLGFEAHPAIGDHFSTALVTGRLSSETSISEIDTLWREGERRSRCEGSDAEWTFFHDVLAPALGFPLLDYVRLQPLLTQLGLDSQQFAEQRADFALETGRGLKLVIEVDGLQHEEPVQAAQDIRRDNALKALGWKVWRVPTQRLQNPKDLVDELTDLMHRSKRGTWGINVNQPPARNQELFDVVWGATVVARIQFLLLQALQRGILDIKGGWRISIVEHETNVAKLAIDDFEDWFGRLRYLYGLPDFLPIELAQTNSPDCSLCILISVSNPVAALDVAVESPLGWSVPEPGFAQEPVFHFNSSGHIVNDDQNILLAFAQDIFRKVTFREGQFEILQRILRGHDVMGLLPTGGGKSLTYQLASLLLPGATLYVAPLKSLLQDQFERMTADGIDAVSFISSALTGQAKLEAVERFECGKVRMLQVAPERFLMKGFRALLDRYQASYGRIVQVVVDECHCVSEWGHDFRPAYLSLSRIVKDRTTRLGSSAPVAALTGTASTIVLEDVRRELGMQDKSVEIRASRLDRPELCLNFVVVNTTEDKTNTLIRKAVDFQQLHGGTNGGFLVFTGHTNGSYGVLNLAGSMAKSLNLEIHKDIRVYSGQVPKNFRLDGISWDNYKSDTQRDFISGLPGSFQIMVATKAFGMGIDKPSIREIVHVLAPQSPEAYYQEVGRAARDRRPANAYLLFSDQHADKTDIILSPATDINEARKIYKDTGKSSGDFLITFYFHAERFQGIEIEVKSAFDALSEIHKKIGNGDPLNISFMPVSPQKRWNEESVLEQSLVRLIHMGVVSDYTKDYLARVFSLSPNPRWLEAKETLRTYIDYLVGAFEGYLSRYTMRVARDLFHEMENATDIKMVENATLRAMVTYLYDEIERKRRTATRTMLEITRIGAIHPKEARKQLLMYLQASAKFTDHLERIAKSDQLSTEWTIIMEQVSAPSEIGELRGAVARVLESYPTHPGLLFLSSIVRIQPNDIDLQRSREEFFAALENASELDTPNKAADLAETALEKCEQIDSILAAELGSSFGRWIYENLGSRFALERTAKRRSGRLHVLKLMLNSATQGLPLMGI